jgi:hypothetical protein
MTIRWAKGAFRAWMVFLRYLGGGLGLGTLRSSPSRPMGHVQGHPVPALAV